jgi:hypothetical protein
MRLNVMVDAGELLIHSTSARLGDSTAGTILKRFVYVYFCGDRTHA